MKIIQNVLEKGVILTALLSILVCDALGFAIIDQEFCPA